MTTEVTRLPIPETLEPKNIKRSLLQNVRGYFYPLYNSTDNSFRELLVSVGNEDAITGNRMFDRYQAVERIKQAATKANDTITSQASYGDVYKCLVKVMNGHPELKPKLRRIEHRRFEQAAHQQAAE